MSSADQKRRGASGGDVLILGDGRRVGVAAMQPRPAPQRDQWDHMEPVMIPDPRLSRPISASAPSC